MGKFLIKKEDFAQLPEILVRIRYCLRNQVGFSLVRVGDAENQVMAQDTCYTAAELKQIWWANDVNWTGVTLPNYTACQQLIKAVRQADIVGVLHQDECELWRPLTEKVFSHYDLRPRQICYAFINIYLPDYPEFIELMQQYRVLLVGKPAPWFAAWLHERWRITAYNLRLGSFEQLPAILTAIDQIDYDLALIAAGSNAVILASALAGRGKVALDIGRAMNPHFWEERWKNGGL
jgi:hypothetical protein